MKTHYKISGFFVFILLVAACSTKKDAFLNRNYHAVATKYNVLFNGNEALKQGLEELNANYVENYEGRLAVEPLKVDVLAMPGMKADQDNSMGSFEKAEEKAVKAVQKHSMVIVRQEKNKQIDDAYLLLGKARYYSKRFVPALEAFNFIILTYPNADLIDETKIWHAKTQIRLQNETQAIANLEAVLDKEEIEEHTREDAHTALALAYAQLDSIQPLMYHLKEAVETHNNREQTARNLFILGQLYNEQNQKDSANAVFNKIIELKKVPDKYEIHAHIEIAKNATTPEEKQAAIETFERLVKDIYNREYQGELYYHLGLLKQSGEPELAGKLFQKSLNAKTVSNYQKELSYEALGNMHFDKADFLTAGAYYDSVIGITRSDLSKRVRRLKRRRASLDEVILFENISQKNDSILGLVAMPLEAQTEFFENHITELKRLEELEKNRTNAGSGFFFGIGKQDNNNSGKWYFYNAQTVGFGAQEFQQRWGNRPLADNWRLSDKTVLSLDGTSNTTENQDVEEPSRKFELEYYLERIPTETSVIEQLKEERNDAYFKLGLIYKEQFKELELAASKFTMLLSFNPDENLIVSSKYHLYKIYDALNKVEKDAFKEDILTNYADSKYAQILLNPEAFAAQESLNSPEKEYESVYYEYKTGSFDIVISKSDIAIQKFEGLPIVAKFELLKAYAIGRRDGLDAFREALQYVATNYSNTEEGKKAIEVIGTLKTKI